MEDDIKALREEIAKLRERVAVLEARPTWQNSLNSQPSKLQQYLQSYPTNDRGIQGNAAFVSGSIPPGTITC